MSAYRIDILPYPCSSPYPHAYGTDRGQSEGVGVVHASGIRRAVIAAGRVIGAQIQPYSIERDGAEGYDRNGRVISITKEQ